MPSLAVIGRATKKALRDESRTIYTNYVQVPIGVAALLIPCWAINLGLYKLHIEFPPSIICMILLFLILLFLHRFSPHRAFPYLCASLKPACNWSLGNVGIFMTPSFITLPLRSTLTGKQVGLVCAWFFPPLLLTWSLDILLCKAISKVIPFSQEDGYETDSSRGRMKTKRKATTHVSGRTIDSPPPRETKHSGRLVHPIIDDARWITTPEPEGSDEEEEEETPRRRAVTLDHLSAQVRPSTRPPSSLPSNDGLRPDSGSDFVRQSAQEFASGSGSILREPGRDVELSRSASEEARTRESASSPEDDYIPGGQDTPESSTQEGILRRERQNLNRDLVTVEIMPEPISSPGPSPEALLSYKLAKLVDLVIYVIVFLVGVVMFYTNKGENRSQLIFIAMISLVWLFSRRIIPHTWTKVLHPTLTTSLLASFGILGLGAIKGLNMTQTLSEFSKEKTYLEITNPFANEGLGFPGAGDILESVLDAGTVGLAFTIFDYRRDLYHNFFRVFLVVFPNCVLSLLFWPFIARQIGALPPQAIVFAGRSMSAPLALELLKIAGGNQNLGIVLVYLTGIAVILLKTPMFRLFKIQTASLKTREDYFTMGVSVGAVGGVIGTSSLLKHHRRAAGTATVALVMFCVIMLSLIAVPQISEFVGHLAGKTSSSEGEGH